MKHYRIRKFFLADDPIVSLDQVFGTEGWPPWKIEDEILRIW